MVILTQGDRDRELERCIESVRDQDFPTEIVLVCNGCEPTRANEASLRILAVEENLGVPEGRNIGAATASGQVVFFLDDDAWLPDRSIVGRAVRLLDADPTRGIIACRVTDPDSGVSLRRWLPRLRKSNLNPGPVATFPGGACLIRSGLFGELGGFPAEFGFSFEETDLAWRVVSAGWDIWFDPESTVHHPATPAGRHPAACRLGMRNRVLLARRYLPMLLWPSFVAGGLLRSLAQRCLGEGLKGVSDGIRWEDPARRPIGWGNVLILTRLGRPPLF